MTEQKHSKTPWKSYPEDLRGGRAFTVARPGQDGDAICIWDEDNGEADAAFIVEAVNNYAALRGALATIHNSTEPGAIKHRDYEHLASNVYAVAKAALDGEFVDDMRAAEVYDELYPRAAVGAQQPRGADVDK